LGEESPRLANFNTQVAQSPATFTAESLGICEVKASPSRWLDVEPDTSYKENFLVTAIDFARANTILDVPLGLGFGFGWIIFTTPTFFTGATFSFFSR
jgi:hypothetical protein